MKTIAKALLPFVIIGAVGLILARQTPKVEKEKRVSEKS